MASLHEHAPLRRWAGGAGGERWPLLALIAVTAALNLTGIEWGLPNADNDWAIDSIAPLGPLAYAESMLYGKQWWSKYPPLHFTILAVAYAPYVAFLAATGGLEPGISEYPYGLDSPDVSLPLFTLMARTVSALMGVGTVAVCYRLTRALTGSRGAGLVAGLLFAGSPLTVYYAHTANLDMPYMFWSSLGLLFLVRVARGAGGRAYIGLGAAAAAAVATKDQAYGIFLLVPMALLLMAALGSAGVTYRRLAVGFASALVVYALAANVLVDPVAWVRHVEFIVSDGSQPYRMFAPTPAGVGLLLWETGRLILLAFGGPEVLLVPLGLAWAIWARPAGAGLLLLAAASYVATFLVPIFYVLPRFVLPLVLVLSVLGGGAAGRIWHRYPGAPRILLAAVALYAPVSGMFVNATLLRDSRYDAEEWMLFNLPVDAVVGLDGHLAYLPRLPDGIEGIPVEIRAEGPLADVEPDFIVLSEAHYRRYLRHERRNLPAEPSPETIERFIAGDLGYLPIATFYGRHPRAARLIPGLSPRIIILQRASSAELPEAS